MRIFVIICFGLLLHGCAMTSFTAKKIDGVSFVAARDKVDATHIAPVTRLGANYAAIMPFGFIRDLAHPEIIHNTDRQWFGETRAGAKQYIDELRKQNIKVMLKPQIWVWRGEFTGHIMMTSEEDWKTLEDAYTAFIMEYADLAQEVNAELFCIGTELELFIKYRPKYWNDLIQKIKGVYTGKLTYAANWDEYRRTPFWEQLDFIGVDAYFPVSDLQTPTIEDCLKGWNRHKTALQEHASEINKKVLFTEFGYRSVDYTAKEPWKSDRSMNQLNLEAQSNALEALFQTFWDENWFAGGFVWKWFHAHDRVGGEENFMFTPQNKPSEKIIANYYTTGNE